MSRSKRNKLIILLCVLVAACIVTFAVTRHEEKKEEIENTDEIVLTLDEASVTGLGWSYEDTDLAFHKDGDVWYYDEDEAFPVNEEKVSELLAQFLELGADFKIENVEDYSQYGLEDPTCTITITTDDGTEHVIKLGAYSTMDEERYITIDDGDVYLVAHDPFEDYEIELGDMLKDDATPVVSEADSILFEGDVDYEIEREEDSDLSYCADDIYFTADGEPLDTSLVSSYLTAIGYLDLSDFVTYNATDEELAECGLDTPELTITVHYTVEEDDTEDGVALTSGDADDADDDSEGDSGSVEKTFVLHVSRNPEEVAEYEAEHPEGEEEETEDTALEATSETTSEDSAYSSADTSEEEDLETAADDHPAAYVRVGDSQIVYRITNDEYETLKAAAYDDLRHQNILSASFDDIEKIDFSLDGADYTITADEKKDEEDEKVWHYEEGDDLDFTSIQSAITALTADQFTDETPSDDAKEEISFTVYLDNENFPEINLTFYRYDGENCLAVVDGESTALVPRSQVVDLVEAVNAVVLENA